MASTQKELENMNKEVLKLKDLMLFLGIGRDKAYGLVSRDDFPSTKIGREYFVVKESLVDWLKDQEGKCL